MMSRKSISGKNLEEAITSDGNENITTTIDNSTIDGNVEIDGGSLAITDSDIDGSVTSNCPTETTAFSGNNLSGQANLCENPPSNNFPVAVDDSGTTLEDTAVIVDVITNDTDLDADTLTVFSVSTPSDGTAVDNGDGTITYTPDQDFNGTDSFDYGVTDGNGGTDTGTVTITVVGGEDLETLKKDGKIAFP